jgi:hypothetical protein
MTGVLESRIYSESPPPGSGAVRLDDFLNPPPPPPSPERQAFEAAVARVMQNRGLSHPEAERAAYEILLVEFLNRTHSDTDPSRCAHCARVETPTLQPIGWGARHTWLHQDCWAPWRERRRAEVIAALAEAGVGA